MPPQRHLRYSIRQFNHVTLRFVLNLLTAVIRLVTGIAAGLSILFVPVWIMGVPGIENEYARGWRMAFSSLLCFPVAYVLTSCTSQDIKKKKFDAKETAMLDMSILSFAVIVFGLALYRLSEAYKVLSRS